MKKAIAFLLCLFMIVALISCNNNGNNTDLSTNDTENTTLVTPGDHTTDTEEKDIVEQPSKVESPRLPGYTDHRFLEGHRDPCGR